MITFRRGRERRHHRVEPEAPAQRNATGVIGPSFGSLHYLEEDRLAPGARVVRPTTAGADIITYVREGNLTFDDGRGSTGTLSAGEFRRLAAERDTEFVELNPSLTEDTHLFQIWLRPTGQPSELELKQRRFSITDRRGLACLVASPDGRSGSLRVRQDALVYSGLLERGQHFVHELAAGRNLWMHVVSGNLMLGDLKLLSGDGVGIANQRAASLTALASSEVLLVEVGATSAGAIGTEGDDHDAVP